MTNYRVRYIIVTDLPKNGNFREEELEVLNNLRAAMAVKKITTLALAQLIGTTEKTVNNKLNGVTDFTLPEALLVRNNLFPEYDLCYLFAPPDEGYLTKR